MNEIKEYTEKLFEDIKHIDENGNEYWLARELQNVLGYNQWRSINDLIERAKVAITNKSFKLEKCNQNDFKKFIKKTNITNDGEIAEKKVLTLIAYLLVFHFLLHILFYFFHLL